MTILYHECSEYKGNDKYECEYISLSDIKMKCKFSNENGCQEQLKECFEASSITECLSIIPSDPNKQCIYRNGVCSLAYKTCVLYQKNSDKIEQGPCERIEINDPTKTYSQFTHKCVYKPATTEEEKASCVTEKLGCKDFSRYNIPDNSRKLNTEMTDIISQKCVFDLDNYICSIKNKTCLEMENLFYYWRYLQKCSYFWF